MDQLAKEIKETLDGLAKTVTALQTKQDEMGVKTDSLDVEMLIKMKEDSAKAVETLADLTKQQAERDTKSEELAKQIDDLEILIAKGGKDDNGMIDEKAYKNGLIGYMRKNAMIDDGALEAVCRNTAMKSAIGIDDDDMEHLVKEMVAGSNPDGGYFLTTDRSDQMSTRIFETSPLRGLANMMTTTSDVMEILLDDDEADAGWVGEVQSRPDTDTPEIGMIKIPIHELYAQPRATQKMLDDAGLDLEAWLSRKVERKLGRMENTSFVVGDGSQKPKGFLTYADWTTAGTYQRNAVEQYDTAAASVIAGNDVIQLQNMLIEDYQAGAAWGMRRATWFDIATLKDDDGRYLLNPRIIAEGADKILLGSPVVFMADMPVVADSALPLVYADFEEFYTIVDRFGIRVLRDPYTAKPYVRFYTTKRVGGAVTNYEAGKILKITAA